MKFKNLLSALALTVLAGGLTVCATEITPEGQRLAETLDSMHVERLWLAGHQVNWRTGEPTGKAFADKAGHTHCSAFAAAAAEKLGIYLLHPPEHSATLLANAQEDWLRSSGAMQGWHAVVSPIQARELANEGELVIVICKNPDKTRPGHVAIVRPSLWSDQKVLLEGPEITQAGLINHTSTSTKEGFKNHPGAFENGQLMYFAHAISWSKLEQLDTAADRSAQ